MRPLHLVVALSLSLAAAPVGAQKGGEKLALGDKAVMHSRPAVKSPVVMTLAAGRTVKVLRHKGSWLKVQAGKEIGWIEPAAETHDVAAAASKPAEEVAEPAKADEKIAAPAAKIAPAKADQPPEKAAARESKQPPHLIANAATIDLPPPKAGATLAAREARLAEAEPIATEELEQDAEAATEAEEARTGPTRHRPIRFSARAGLGFRLTSGDFSSNGNGGLGGYRLTANALSAQLGGAFAYRPGGGRLQLGVEGAYRVEYANPGIHYDASNGQSGDVGFSEHELEATGLAGFVGRRVHLGARLGYHYDVFKVDQLGNVARMGNEALSGPTVGAQVELPGVGKKLALRTQVDVLVAGERRQTTGLEDGMRSTAKAFWGELGLTYQLSRGFEFEASYRLGWTHTSWTGPSSRQADVTEASRTDYGHTVIAGVSRGL